MPNKLILVADDEPYLDRSLSFVLKREGYQVEAAVDGPETLEKVRLLKPDLLFLDLQLPKMDGVEVCRRIKSDPELKKTYIIVLTAKGQSEDRSRAVAANSNEYMTKPFSPKDLVSHLRRLFGA